MTDRNVLAISWKGKAVPYGGTGELRPDGDANYGFKNLKGHPERLADVPELGRDPALRDCVAAINAPETAVFSIGCVSGTVSGDEGHRVYGYVEFAFNSDVLAEDAGHYFPVFFHFDWLLRDSGFAENVYFHWELMSARFHEVDADGFTASVTINTGFHETQEAARSAWAKALALLSDHLLSLPPPPGSPLVR